MKSPHYICLLFVIQVYCASGANPVTIENGLPGTTTWQLTNPATNREIEGYASLTSVNQGGQINLFISTGDASYTIDIYRMGWYGGAGGREVLGPVTLPGIRQATPSLNPTTGLAECQWINPYVISVPTSWISGVYLAKLTGSQTTKQSYIIFVVREDSRPSAYLFQSSVTTYQAYNNWPGQSYGGRSLYDFNSLGNLPGVKVSFNRPYALGVNPTSAAGVGAGEFLTSHQPASSTPTGGWEYSMVRFMEKEGYDVSYCTNLDTHQNAALLLSHKAFLSVGHDEYWSWAMRTNVEAARDQGISLAFFSANTCYWQIRFEPSTADGTANRTMVCYKSLSTDPYALDSDPSNDRYITAMWRQNSILPPEEALLGVEYIENPINSDVVIADASHWALAGTGLTTGQKLTGLLGYEVDGMLQPAARPNVSVIAHSPIPVISENATKYAFADMTSYTAVSGATVFAVGTIWWAWGLDDYGAPALRPARSSNAAKQITRNVLNKIIQPPVPPAKSGFAQWLNTDFTTKGNWQGTYGAAGATIINDASNMPPSAVISVSGQTPFTWGTPTDSRALNRLSSPGRIAAAWYSSSSFSIDVNLTDGSKRQFAIYCLDWDGANSRAEQIDVVDYATSSMLDSRIVSSFSNGEWVVWNISGHVVFNIRRTAGSNAVISGLFLGNPQGNQPPVVNAGPNQTITLPNGVVLNGTASDDGLPNNTLTVTWSVVSGPGTVTFGNPQVASTTATFSTAGVYVLQLAASDGVLTSTSQTTITVNQPGLIAAAQYVTTDTATSGNWKGVYGADGAIVVNDASAPPAYALVNPSGQSAYTWTSSTSDSRALLRASAAGRIAATWFSGSSFTIDVNANDNKTHQISLYCLDWDGGNSRGQKIEVLDAGTNALLDSRTISSFSNGVYLVWSVTGHVVFRITRTAGSNAVVSGLFWGGSPVNQPPVVNAGPNQTITLPASAALSGTATDDGLPNHTLTVTWSEVSGPGTVTFVSPNALQTSASFSAAGVYILQLAASDSALVSTSQVTITVNAVPPPGPVVAFVNTDTVTQGNWKGVYGGAGAIVVDDASAPPAYAVVTPSGQLDCVWQTFPMDPRALSRISVSGRIAATWYSSPSFKIDVNHTDGKTHQLAIYSVDWDGANTRAQRVEVIDPGTNTILDTRNLTAFSSGQYLVWNISGHVVIRITSTVSSNAVVSGMFWQ